MRVHVPRSPFYGRGGGVGRELRGGGGAPPTRMGVLHSRQATTLLRSCSSTSMYLRHFGLGHWTAKTITFVRCPWSVVRGPPSSANGPRTTDEKLLDA